MEESFPGGFPWVWEVNINLERTFCFAFSSSFFFVWGRNFEGVCYLFGLSEAFRALFLFYNVGCVSSFLFLVRGF